MADVDLKAQPAVVDGVTPAPPAPAPDSADVKPVSYGSLFRYSDWVDIVVVIVGSLCALINGITMPAFSILFGALLNHLKTDNGNFGAAITNVCDAFLVVGGVAFVCSIGEMSLMNISATRQIRKVRSHYFRSLLRQVRGAPLPSLPACVWRACFWGLPCLTLPPRGPPSPAFPFCRTLAGMI